MDEDLLYYTLLPICFYYLTYCKSQSLYIPRKLQQYRLKLYKVIHGAT